MPQSADRPQRPEYYELESYLNAVAIADPSAVIFNEQSEHEVPYHELVVTKDNLRAVAAAFSQEFTDMADAQKYFYLMTGLPVAVSPEDIRGQETFSVHLLHTWFQEG